MGDPVGMSVVVLFYGSLLAWLYVLVHRNAHPSRSKVVAFLTALGVICGGVIAMAFTTLLLTMLAGYHPSPPSPNDPIAKAIIGVGIGGILGAVVLGWIYVRGRISKPKAA